MAISSDLKSVAEEFLDSKMDEEIKKTTLEQLEKLEKDFDYSIDRVIGSLRNNLSSFRFTAGQQDKIIEDVFEKLRKNY